jgi:hypothetical protein
VPDLLAEPKIFEEIAWIGFRGGRIAHQRAPSCGFAGAAILTNP